MSESKPNPKFKITWPLFEPEPKEPFPEHPRQTLSAYAPLSSELRDFSDSVDFDEPSSPAPPRQFRQSLPPEAPDWARAARTLADELEQAISRGYVDPIEQEAISRAWAAWLMGGTQDQHILRVAHVVSRAHKAIREAPAPGQDINAAIFGCAGVLHAALPSGLRERMPMERVVFVVRQLRQEADPWAAVVEGASELLGWKDYARGYAASIIRTLIEHRGGHDVGG